MTFETMGLAPRLLARLAEQKITEPTPIQSQAIPPAMEGRDVMGLAQTGTGKTAAFALPILQQLSAERVVTRQGRIRALILAPTRELVVQIEKELRRFGRNERLFTQAVYGGVGRRPQIEGLRRGADIVVATPGRFLDLYDEGHITLEGLTHFVLDEADRMLDMGFIHAIRRIVGDLPKQRRSLLFSATMPKTVEGLARDILDRPEKVEIARQTVAPSAIDQKVIHVATPEKRGLLKDLLQDESLKRVIVFTRTKHMANRVAEQLDKAGFSSEALHGNKSQSARQNALKRFQSGKARVLVATDIAARGIDVTAISHVINYDLPNEPENYVHRIGRTARAGRDGAAVAYCAAHEMPELQAIEKTMGRQIPVLGGAAWPMERKAKPSRGGASRGNASAKPGGQRRRRKPRRSGGQRMAA